MSVRYTGAGVGLILGIVAAFALVGLCLFGVINVVRSDLQNQNGTVPIRRIQPTQPGGG